MANKIAPGAEPLDVKELVASVDAASSLLAHAAEAFADIVTIFDAIKASTASSSLAGRLTRLGESLCEERVGDFEQYRDDFSDLAQRFLTQLDARAEVANG